MHTGYDVFEEKTATKLLSLELKSFNKSVKISSVVINDSLLFKLEI